MKLNCDHLKVRSMCRALEVSPSGYYDWLQRPLSAHAQKDQVLSVRIVTHFEANRHVYGTRRLKDCLADKGEQVSRPSSTALPHTYFGEGIEVLKSTSRCI
jgi:hypothetical protein